MINKIEILLEFFYSKDFIHIEYRNYPAYNKHFLIPKKAKKIIRDMNYYFSKRVNNSKSFKIRYAKRKNLPQWTLCSDITPRKLIISNYNLW